jgi:hypothetical protein
MPQRDGTGEERSRNGFAGRTAQTSRGAVQICMALPGEHMHTRIVALFIDRARTRAARTPRRAGRKSCAATTHLVRENLCAKKIDS